MRRKERDINGLLRAVHQGREQREPSAEWRESVMADVAGLRMEPARAELERLAPRFAMTAAVVFLTAAVAGSWTLGSLSGDILAAYTTRALSVVSLPWYGM